MTLLVFLIVSHCDNALKYHQPVVDRGFCFLKFALFSSRIDVSHGGNQKHTDDQGRKYYPREF
jgi:hypothetical protein